MPPAFTVSTDITLPDLNKAKFLLDDSSLTHNIKDLLLRYPQIFSKLPDSRGIDCPPMTIEFYDESEIVSKNARYLPPDKLRIANEQIDLLIEHRFAVPYDGPFSSPICLVQAPRKPPRLTGDYSGSDGINAKTVPIPADLPRISDVCRFLSNATYIAALDLPKAFWQLNLHPDDQPKTAISIPGRKVMFTRASFGLKNVPAIETLSKLSPPTSVPELRSFVGSINFIRDWLPSVSAELAPLTAVLQKKPKKIKLGEKEIKCFENIETMLINSTPLALPDANSTILISTDASDKAIAGIIWKELEPSPPGTCLSKRKIAPIPVLQSFEFDIVHIEGPKNFWADYLSCTNLDSPKKNPGKKERKTRNSTPCTKNTIEKCCSLLRPNSVHGNSLSSLFNDLNLADLELGPITWYNLSYKDAAKVIHPSALRHPKSAFAEINALKP
ncbi:hypothetical protein P9112_000638 [Eukaryota sp. TZLM1-RC]